MKVGVAAYHEETRISEGKHIKRGRGAIYHGFVYFASKHNSQVQFLVKNFYFNRLIAS
jgi:hypothetical protein